MSLGKGLKGYALAGSAGHEFALMLDPLFFEVLHEPGDVLRQPLFPIPGGKMDLSRKNRVTFFGAWKMKTFDPNVCAMDAVK